MRYFTNLFSPETYEAFSESDRTVSGFRKSQRKSAQNIEPGDRFICYMTKLSRWVGVLEILEGPYEDDTPIFYPDDDPFVVRFKVKPVAWLPKEKTLPIHESEVWDQLTFTKEHEPGTSTWTGKIRRSLREMDPQNAQLLEKLILRQTENGKVYDLDESEWRKLVTHRIRRTDKTVSVTVPEGDDTEDAELPEPTEVRDSIRVQALLADLGTRMGLRIWVPRNDRNRVAEQMEEGPGALLDILPLNYDDTTLQTIEYIDVLWLRGRSIARAFEVEHTTSIYSGILRMADLLALQPNMDIRLHIVAPASRREKVKQEIRRPVFSLLDRGPLAESCSYLPYEAIEEVMQLPHLAYTSDDVVDEYAEEAE